MKQMTIDKEYLEMSKVVLKADPYESAGEITKSVKYHPTKEESMRYSTVNFTAIRKPSASHS